MNEVALELVRTLAIVCACVGIAGLVTITAELVADWKEHRTRNR